MHPNPPWRLKPGPGELAKMEAVQLVQPKNYGLLVHCLWLSRKTCPETHRRPSTKDSLPNLFVSPSHRNLPPHRPAMSSHSSSTLRSLGKTPRLKRGPRDAIVHRDHGDLTRVAGRHRELQPVLACRKPGASAGGTRRARPAEQPGGHRRTDQMMVLSAVSTHTSKSLLAGPSLMSA